MFYSLGGSGPVIWSYFAEFQPKSRRGSMLSFMAAFWTIGNLFVAGLAWVIIPSGKRFIKNTFRMQDFKLTFYNLQVLVLTHHTLNTIPGEYFYCCVHCHHLWLPLYYFM